MSAEKVQRRGRSLAEIEIDLLKAEDAFAEADTRFKKAQHDRRAALNLIDKHQVEMDKCFLDLRQRSVPGTSWRQEGGDTEETLELNSAHIASEEARNGLVPVLRRSLESLTLDQGDRRDDQAFLTC